MKKMKCYVCKKVLYSDALAKSCRFCGMPLSKNLKKDFCCNKCRDTFKEIRSSTDA